MKVLNAMFYIYRHIRPDTGEVFYIGLGRYQKNWKYQRAHTTKNRNIHWQRIVNKCEGHFIVDILLDSLTQPQAETKERLFIMIYGRSDLGLGTLCNLTNGGEGTQELSQESRDKISQSMKGSKNHMFGKEHTQDFKDNMKIKMSGSNNPNFGKPLPEHHKEINRQTQLGRKHSKDTIEARVSQFRKKVQWASDGIINITFDSISHAADYYHVAPSTITRWCKSGKNDLRVI